MNNQENLAIEGASISNGQRTIIGTPSNIRHRIINGSGTDRRQLQLALLFIVLQAASLALEIFGGKQLAYLLASFILSVIGFLSTAYSVVVSRTDRETDRNTIELVFSIVQLIMAFVHLTLANEGIKFSPNIASIFPLVLAITVFALACKQNESASSVTSDRRRQLLLALLFIVFETAFLAIGIFGGNQLAYLLASFILSVIGFLSTAYSVRVSRLDLQTDRNMIELVFSTVQLIMAFVHLTLANEGIKFSSNIASIFPLVLAITAFALACKQNEPASVTPDHTDVERGEPENVPEESQISSGTADTSEEEVTTSSETELSNLEEEQIGPNGVEEHLQIPEGQ